MLSTLILLQHNKCFFFEKITNVSVKLLQLRTYIQELKQKHEPAKSSAKNSNEQADTRMVGIQIKKKHSFVSLKHKQPDGSAAERLALILFSDRSFQSFKCQPHSACLAACSQLITTTKIEPKLFGTRDISLPS
jgi:hypothetical protein